MPRLRTSRFTMMVEHQYRNYMLLGTKTEGNNFWRIRVAGRGVFCRILVADAPSVEAAMNKAREEFYSSFDTCI